MHETDGDYEYDQEDNSGDEGEYEGLLDDNGSYAYYSHGGGAGPGMQVKPSRAINATGPPPGRRGGPTPCWNVQCDRAHNPFSKNALCGACCTFEF